MTASLYTERLTLIPLSRNQLDLYLRAPARLELELGLALARELITERVQRALQSKIAKMAVAHEATHAWFTYWLIVITDTQFGAGLAGFKGLPDAHGQVEIGYGIDPGYQRKGYTTEAVRALITWAFQSPDCQAVIAREVMRENVASLRVLTKVGMQKYAETADTLCWRITKS